ncbi:MAG: ATP-binding protein [ANME-2 cluster archaeon]|nr:ATP-binding protein [ANME-2 cluster archaeon]MBC2700586.1 ATP-binding protein [ANME-2 cluster archaeon]MBC2708731.1 ATP-binding protein [ANME-2 cluster archaeon]
MDKETIKKLIILAQERDVKFAQRDTQIYFSGKINTIIGSRRAGKTYFMYQIINQLKSENKDKIIYINFEDERLFPIKKEELDLILDAYYELYPDNKDEKLYIFFDEIQEVPFWETFLRRLYDQENVEICVTGSSSKLLSKEIATGLRGRTLTYRIFPYSFKEFLNVKGLTLQRNFEYTPLRHKIKNLLIEYIEFGGFPEIVDKDNTLKTKILQEYFDLIFYKDLVDRYQIRSFATVKEMLLYLVNNFSSYFSTNKYYNNLKSQGKKISKNTLFTYLACAADINFIFIVPKYGKLKEQFANPKKVYVIDTGLINAISFKFSQNIGRLYENVVLIELKRRDKDVYYWKNKYECDFLTTQGREVEEAIQVCYELTDENKDREINGLIEAVDEFKLNDGLIITGDLEGEEIKGGKKIVYKPLWKWLLK